MIYNARAESPQSTDSSVVDKRVQVFDPGGEAKELPSIQITSGNQPWVDKAELSENAEGLAGVVSAGKKHEMVKSLQGRNHIWEIVGSGVNNVQALKRAIIGVAVTDDLGAARNNVEIADTLSVLAATLMLCETNAKPGKSSDTSTEEKIMMTFDPGGEAPDVPYFSYLSQFQFEVHLRNKNWAVFDCLRIFSLSSLKTVEGTLQFALNLHQMVSVQSSFYEVLVGQRHGGGGSHGSQGVRLNLHTEIPKLDLEDKVDFKGRALIQSDGILSSPLSSRAP